MNTIDTREAGGGSYPEPPQAWYGSEPEACEECGYAGKYRSRMQPKAFVASLTAWLARYNCQIIFCEPATTGKLIREVLYRELKERLEVMECPQAITDS